MRKATFLLLFILTFTIINGVVCGAAESPKDYYRGERVVLVVPFKPGGGFDAYARILSQFLSKEIDAKFIVSNKPGGGGYRGANWLYLSAPRNGKTIALLNGQTMLTNELFGETKVAKFKSLKEFSMIASWSGTDLAVMLNLKRPYNSFNDIRGAKGLKSGATDPLGTHAISGAMTALLLDLQDFRMIVGYSSSSELISAVLKGETDIYASAYDTCKRYQDQGFAKVIGLFGEKSPFFPNVPTINDLDLTPEGEKWFKVMRDTRKLLRLFAGPPGVPQERIKYLSAAFFKVLGSKEFNRELKKRQMMFPTPVNYEETIKRIDKVLSLSEKDRKDFRYLVEKRYR
jgi:tripartite-type tricarboxylate transporter receptor subunit TctC